MAITLTKTGNQRLVYSDGTWEISIVISRISTYEKKNGESILIDMSGKDLSLKFDDGTTRNDAYDIIDAQFP